jgi:hypothetical protein
MATADVLRKLIRACVDDAHESGGREHEQFVTDLERLANREESRDGSWTELATRTEP